MFHSWLSLERMSDTGLSHICIKSFFLLFSTFFDENIWTKGIIMGLQVYFNISTLFHPSPPPSQGIKMVVKNTPFPQNTLPFWIQTFGDLLITSNILSNTCAFHQLFIELKITMVQHSFSTSELHTSFFLRQRKILRMFFLGCSLQTAGRSILFLRRKPSPGLFLSPWPCPAPPEVTRWLTCRCLCATRQRSLTVIAFSLSGVFVSLQNSVKLCPPFSGP